MAWQQLQFTIQASSYLAVTELLENLGAVAISLTDAHDEAIYEPQPGTTPLWQEAILSALFPSTQDLTPLIQILYTLGFTQVTHQSIEDQAWERLCLDQFKPMRFGEDLWVCPSWNKITPPNATLVELDPGLAFGTGSHPTTRLCLEWLATHMVKNKTVIDYGCGSGILSIAALKRGAQFVYGIDIDPQACQATEENLKRNQLTNNQYWIGPPEQLPTSLTADIIIANILAQPLIGLVPSFTTYLREEGNLVLSGILIEQSDAVIAAYAPYFKFLPPLFQKEWACLIGMKK